MKDKSISDLYDKFYSKKKKINLKCLDCGKAFSKKVGPTDTTKVKCPKCKSDNVDIF
jgi:Zn finger protein HypA/HybF involved in hydrogenase expression